MVYPVANRGGGRRDSFRAGRFGRGMGRTGGREHVWQRSNRGGDRAGQEPDGDSEKRGNQLNTDHDVQQLGGEVGKDEGHQNWDRAVVKDKQSDGRQGGSDARWNQGDKSSEHNEGGTNMEQMQDSKKQEMGDKRNSQNKAGCSYCGLKNHTTEECRRKNACELCGLNNHNASKCRREPLWNCGPELCTAQVPDQSFFFIEEQIDHRASKEKASTAIITVTTGEITAKQIEMELRNILGPEVWRWSARQVADNKFTMRFQNAKMVQDYSNFKLGMKYVDAQLTNEPWSSSIGAKGEL